MTTFAFTIICGMIAGQKADLTGSHILVMTAACLMSLIKAMTAAIVMTITYALIDDILIF